MNGVFAKRRARLLAMKALRDSYTAGERTFTCPACGQESDRRSEEHTSELQSHAY